MHNTEDFIDLNEDIEDSDFTSATTKAKASDYKENGFEWLNGQDKVCFSFSQQRFINKVMELAKKYPDEVDIVAVNKDGSVTGHLPLSYLRISRPREMTEEQRLEAIKRLKNYKESEG